MAEGLLSNFELGFLERIVDGDQDLLALVRNHASLRTYWEDLLTRYRAHLIAHVEHAASAQVLMPGSIARASRSDGHPRGLPESCVGVRAEATRPGASTCLSQRV